MVSRFVAAAVAGAMALGAGFAQAQTPAPAGPMGSASAVSGQVVVQRGPNTYTLSANDQIFPGDRVLTRNGGSVILNQTAPPCSRALESAQSIVIDADFCTKPIIALGPNEANLALAGAGGGIPGGTPAVLGLLALGGGAAAAAAGGGDSASP